MKDGKFTVTKPDGTKVVQVWQYNYLTKTSKLVKEYELKHEKK